MSDQQSESPQTASEASALFRSADKRQQQIIEAVLHEERQVMHQKYRTKIYDNIVGIIKEQVQ